MDSLLCGYLRFGKAPEKIIFVIDTDTPIEGTDGHTYLRGEYQEQEVSGSTLTSSPA